jgi:phenylalanyl-tRNA synthetase beta chain
MKISPAWLREFVDLKVDARQLAQDLTMAGVAVEGISGQGASTVYEVEVSPNRVDAMNHYGIARECSAIYDTTLKPLPVQLPAFTVTPDFAIQIDDPQGCARYTARIVRGVKIAPSPNSVQYRLELLESRPINNAADATNYTLQETGHPTHAFDLDLLEGGKIIVRRARQGETLRTLDGIDRKLSPDDLVIADAAKPVALAGVMGGFDSMITERTRNVLIESAWFDPGSVRHTARRHGMHTDASHRFERGADINAAPVACARVAQLILEWAGGQLDGAEIDAYPRRLQRVPVRLRRSEVLRHLGQEIAEQEIERILRRLGFVVTPGRASTAVAMPGSARTSGAGGAHAAVAEEVADFSVQLPSWRLDVGREIDLIEEIARIYGYNRFPNTLPAFSGAVVDLPDAHKDARVRESLLALGYNEAVSLSFISRQDAQQFSTASPVELANPISEEASVMRTSLVPGMLAMLGWNLNRGNFDVRLFEAGNVFERTGDDTAERLHIALGATGSALPATVHQPARPFTFFDLKGDVEQLLGSFEHGAVYYDSFAAEYYHPGRSARAVMDGATVARFGQIHPEIAAARKLRGEIYVAELYLDRLYTRALREPRYQPIPRFPAVERDFSFVFDNSVSFERIRSTVDALRIAELRSFVPVEIFLGGNVPAGKYSLLLRASFQSAERTLRDDEVALWGAQIIKALETVGGTLRA